MNNSTQWFKLMMSGRHGIEALLMRNLDVVTRVLHRVVPLRLQHRFRDVGGVRYLLDGVAIVGSVFLCAVRPALVSQYRCLGGSMTRLQYGETSEEMLDIYDYCKDNKGNFTREQPANKTDTENSVVVFVHGGSWGSGQPWMYRLITAGLARSMNASKGIVLGYPVYPAASILKQSMCVVNATNYLDSRRDELGINDETKVILIGHSSGANICALAAIYMSKMHTKKIADVFVGLSGVYDITKYYAIEKDRGVHEVSPMAAAALGQTNFPDCGPSQILKNFANHPSPNHNVDAVIGVQHLPQFWLLHGLVDTTVPCSQTKEFETTLLEKQCSVRASYLTYSHLDIIVDCMMGKDNTSQIQNTLKEFWNDYNVKESQHEPSV
jgi:acetyl esterase/lipase